MNVKQFVLNRIHSRWKMPRKLEEGYAVLLAMPMDMPFLLRFALEMLKGMDTTHCRQIIVIPDAMGFDRGAGLRRELASFDDPRIELVELSALDYRLARLMKPHGGSGTHWNAVVNGLQRTRCKYALMHDADAFFRDGDDLERIYRTCRDEQMHTLGVTPRWDPFFTKIDYFIPGTWETMISVDWVRTRKPLEFKGVWRNTPHGSYEFDTFLYPQYLDHPTGKVGCLTPPPQFVHFNGTIFTYRTFRDAAGKQVVDELFRVLLLAIFEDLVPSPDGRRVVPTVGELARGLTDETAPVVYNSQVAIRGYATFRRDIDELCVAPIFQGERAAKIQALLQPFDAHFGDLAQKAGGSLGPPIERLRTAGLGTSTTAAQG